MRAAAVPDAARSVDNHGLAVDDVEDALLGTSAHARSAADALAQVDVRVLQARRVTAARLGLGQLLEPARHAHDFVPALLEQQRRDEQRENEDSKQCPTHDDSRPCVVGWVIESARSALEPRSGILPAVA